MVDPSRQAELDRALELMYFGFKRLVEAPDQLLARRGLARMHHRVLYFVARRPGLSVTELLAALAVTKQAVHGPLGGLVRQGLLRSAPDPDDRRVRRLRLTARGAALEAALSGMQRDHLERVFREAGRRSEVGWREVMDRLGAGAAARVDSSLRR